MTDRLQTSDLESLVRIEPEGESWRVVVPGWGSFPLGLPPRQLSSQIIEAMRFAFKKGRGSAFSDLRTLIGAQHVEERDYDI